MERMEESSSPVDHQGELGADVVVPEGPKAPPVTAKVIVPVPEAAHTSQLASGRRANARRIAGSGAGLLVLGVVVALAIPRYGALAYGVGGVAFLFAVAAATYVWLVGAFGRSSERSKRAHVTPREA